VLRLKLLNIEHLILKVMLNPQIIKKALHFQALTTNSNLRDLAPKFGAEIS
jgi:hypothetical protein